MESFLPTETARLVYGYLVGESCEEAAQLFLETSLHLKECLLVQKKGRRFTTTIFGKTLVDILDVLAETTCIVRSYTQKSGQKRAIEGELIESLKKVLFISNTDESKFVISSTSTEGGKEKKNDKEGSLSTESGNIISLQDGQENSDEDDNPNTHVLQTLLGKKILHEVIADNINKAAESSNELSLKMTEAAMNSTEADPIFDEILKELVGTSQPSDTSTPDDTEHEMEESSRIRTVQGEHQPLYEEQPHYENTNINSNIGNNSCPNVPDKLSSFGEKQTHLDGDQSGKAPQSIQVLPLSNLSVNTTQHEKNPDETHSVIASPTIPKSISLGTLKPPVLSIIKATSNIASIIPSTLTCAGVSRLASPCNIISPKVFFKKDINNSSFLPKIYNLNSPMALSCRDPLIPVLPLKTNFNDSQRFLTSSPPKERSVQTSNSPAAIKRSGARTRGGKRSYAKLSPKKLKSVGPIKIQDQIKVVILDDSIPQSPRTILLGENKVTPNPLVASKENENPSINSQPESNISEQPTNTNTVNNIGKNESGANDKSKDADTNVNQDGTPEQSSETIFGIRKKLSLSTPRKRSHIRTLDFQTPPKGPVQNRKTNTAPKNISLSRVPILRNSLRNVKRNELFKSPVKQKEKSPVKQKEKSLVNQKEKSPVKQKEKPPVKQKEKSPVKQKEKLPVKQKEKKAWDADLRSYTVDISIPTSVGLRRKPGLPPINEEPKSKSVDDCKENKNVETTAESDSVSNSSPLTEKNSPQKKNTNDLRKEKKIEPNIGITKSVIENKTIDPSQSQLMCTSSEQNPSPESTTPLKNDLNLNIGSQLMTPNSNITKEIYLSKPLTPNLPLTQCFIETVSPQKTNDSYSEYCVKSPLEASLIKECSRIEKENFDKLQMEAKLKNNNKFEVPKQTVLSSKGNSFYETPAKTDSRLKPVEMTPLSKIRHEINKLGIKMLVTPTLPPTPKTKPQADELNVTSPIEESDANSEKPKPDRTAVSLPSDIRLKEKDNHEISTQTVIDPKGRKKLSPKSKLSGKHESIAGKQSSGEKSKVKRNSKTQEPFDSHKLIDEFLSTVKKQLYGKVLDSEHNDDKISDEDKTKNLFKDSDHNNSSFGSAGPKDTNKHNPKSDWMSKNSKKSEKVNKECVPNKNIEIMKELDVIDEDSDSSFPKLYLSEDETEKVCDKNIHSTPEILSKSQAKTTKSKSQEMTSNNKKSCKAEESVSCLVIETTPNKIELNDKTNLSKLASKSENEKFMELEGSNEVPHKITSSVDENQNSNNAVKDCLKSYSYQFTVDDDECGGLVKKNLCFSPYFDIFELNFKNESKILHNLSKETTESTVIKRVENGKEIVAPNLGLAKNSIPESNKKSQQEAYKHNYEEIKTITADKNNKLTNANLDDSIHKEDPKIGENKSSRNRSKKRKSRSPSYSSDERPTKKVCQTRSNDRHRERPLRRYRDNHSVKKYTRGRPRSSVARRRESPKRLRHSRVSDDETRGRQTGRELHRRNKRFSSASKKDYRSFPDRHHQENDLPRRDRDRKTRSYKYDSHRNNIENDSLLPLNSEEIQEIILENKELNKRLQKLEGLKTKTRARSNVRKEEGELSDESHSDSGNMRQEGENLYSKKEAEHLLSPKVTDANRTTLLKELDVDSFLSLVHGSDK